MRETKCSHCHERVDLEWKFCPHCGRTLVDEKIIYWFFKALKTKKIAYGFLIFEIIFIALVSFMMVSSSKKLQEKNKVIDEMLKSKRALSIDWSVKENVFPISYVGDNQQLVEIKISSESYEKIKVESHAEGITATQAKLIDIKPGGNVIRLGPEITEEGYARLSDSRTVPVHLKVTLQSDQPKEIINESKATKFFSINDISWYDAEGASNIQYVVRLANKDKIEVKNLIRQSADHMKELGAEQNAMVGPLGDESDVMRQLGAIYLAIAKDNNIRYVMAPYSYDSIDVQKIKSPSEVISTKSGLCIELSLLVAAALENLGLSPVIVVTADHAWPGVELSPGSNQYLFIETTLLDKSPAQALEIGAKNWKEVENSPGSYKLLKINELRTEGLMPMKY